MTREDNPRDFTASEMIDRIRGVLGAASDPWTLENANCVPFRSPIAFASFAIDKKSLSIVLWLRSRSSSMPSTFPGVALGAPGNASIRPTVPT